MNTIEVIKLINAKIFHDLGNSITAISLMGDTNSSIVADLLFQFNLMRQVFVETENDLSSCYDMLTKHLEKKKVNLNFTNKNTELLQDQTQIILNLTLFLAKLIAYSGNISMHVNNTSIEFTATATKNLDYSGLSALTDETSKLNIHNIQAHFIQMLVKQQSGILNYFHAKDSSIIEVKVMFDNI